jgi:uncharacterized protein
MAVNFMLSSHFLFNNKMAIQLIISAFVLGFAGSFHCVGMCGPIALTVPYNSNNDASRWLAIAKYLLGKTITYTIAGMLFGLLGRQLVLIGLQQILSIVLGTILLLIVVLMLFRSHAYHTSFIQQIISNKLIPVFGKLLKNPTGTTAFLLGMLNGLLPCGLVYMGLLGATATGTALTGALFMFWFGIGTIPVMFSFLVLANRFSFSFRQKIKNATPYFIAIAGVMLILRGLNLDIPFLSPDFKAMIKVGGDVITCHP